MKINDFYVLRLWRAGNDTWSIAHKIGVEESLIANALARIFARPGTR